MGRYFDGNGQPTEYSRQVEQWIAEASVEKDQEEEFKKKYPPCNVEYKPETGSRVWCSTASGGIQRDWVGHPRSLHSVGADGKTIRCACVQPQDLDDPLIKPYPNCEPDAVSCKLAD